MAKRWVVVAAVACAALAPGAAGAVELKNDGFVDMGAAGFQGGFVAGEIGAVRLVPSGAPSYQVTHIRVLFGGAGSEQSVTFKVWDDSAGTLAPGTELLSRTEMLTGSDEFMQEIDISGDGVLVTGPFRVGLQFSHAGVPSIARDDDGTINASRNFIYSPGLGGWVQSATALLTGDWIIRAEVLPIGEGTPDAGPGPQPDASIGAPDAGTGGACGLNSDCPNGMYCNDDGVCDLDCRLNIDCVGGLICSAVGQCVPEDPDGGGGDGCGCRAPGSRAGAAGAWLLLGALALLRRRR